MSDATCGGEDGEKRGSELEGASLDNALGTLADEKRRYALHYFQNETNNVASVKDLADYIIMHDSEINDVDHVRIALHHQDLPKLDEAGLIEYDARSETVRYHGDSAIEGLLEYISDVE